MFTNKYYSINTSQVNFILKSKTTITNQPVRTIWMRHKNDLSKELYLIFRIWFKPSTRWSRNRNKPIAISGYPKYGSNDVPLRKSGG